MLARALGRLPLALALVLWGAVGLAQQLSYSSGQTVAPAYEGWEANDDGTFNLLFGYMNENWDEELDVPIGPDNTISPGGPDRGQPTHFLPRRNRFVFKIRVPADFGSNEVVWTLTTKGKTTRAYGSLRPDYFLEPVTLISEKGGIGGGGSGSAEIRANKAPTLTIDGPKRRTITVGEPLGLIAAVADDGVPPPRRQGALSSPISATQGIATPKADYRPPRSVTVNSATGLRVSWYVYRGAGPVDFDPPQIKVWEDTREGANSPWAPHWAPPPLPPDGRIFVEATFHEPGEYVLRCLADDGGLWDGDEIIVTVAP